MTDPVVRVVIATITHTPTHCLHRLGPRRLCILRPGHDGAHLPLPGTFPASGAA